MESSAASKTLLYFTQRYPFGDGEQFVASEIVGLSKKFEKIYVIPFKNPKTGPARTLPDNCLVQDFTNPGGPGPSLIGNVSLLKLLIGELGSAKNKRIVLKKYKYFLGNLKQASRWAHTILDFVESLESSNVEYYSTWMNQHALALSLLKKNGNLENFSFKMRGHDLFDERQEGNHMPFRKLIFSQARWILTMSKQGRDYLKEKNIHPERIRHNYPGIDSPGKNQMKEGVFTLVSCSGLVELKRVILLAQALKICEFPIRWVHFGDGPERQEIQKVVDELPGHVEAELKGRVSNQEIVDFYLHEKIDSFIHLSRTEGFGYAIIEAYCAGIPAILYPAGGVIELAQPQCSVKVDEDITPQSVLDAITTFRSNMAGIEGPRAEAFKFFEENFQIESNSNELYQYITGNAK